MQGWIGVIVGGLFLVGGALIVRTRVLVPAELAPRRAQGLLVLGFGAATILRSSAELSGWTGGGLAATEILQVAFALALVTLFAVPIAHRLWAKRQSRKTEMAPDTESRARLESLLVAAENEFQRVSRDLEQYEALEREVNALAAELQTVRDGDPTAAGSSAALREAVTALDASAARAATVTRELRSAYEAGRASFDWLRAAVGVGEIVGPLPEVEAALATLSERVHELELTQARDRVIESIAAAKALFAKWAPQSEV